MVFCFVIISSENVFNFESVCPNVIPVADFFFFFSSPVKVLIFCKVVIPNYEELIIHSTRPCDWFEIERGLKLMNLIFCVYFFFFFFIDEKQYCKPVSDSILSTSPSSRHYSFSIQFRKSLKGGKKRLKNGYKETTLPICRHSITFQFLQLGLRPHASG